MRSPRYSRRRVVTVAAPQIPTPPAGYVLEVDALGNYVVDVYGNYSLVPAP